MCHINILKNRKDMIFSLEVEKAFDKIQHPFMLKVKKNWGLQGPYVRIIKAVHNRPTVSSILHGENKYATMYNKPTVSNILNGRTWSISTKITNKAKISTLSTHSQYSASSPSYGSKASGEEKEREKPMYPCL